MRFILAKLGLGAIRNDPAIRAVAFQTLFSRIGNGLFMTIEVIYVSVVVGLNPHEIAIALGAGGLVMLVFSVPAGIITDKFGARKVMLIAHVLEGLALLPLMFVRDFWSLLFINVVVATMGTTGYNASSALISTLGEGEDRVAIRAAQRAMANMGIGLGTVLAGIALAINTTIAYQVTIFADFLLFVVSALYILRLPNLKPKSEKGERTKLVAIRDWRYLAATFLNGVVSTHFVVQGVALPLWILQSTMAPKWWVSVLFVINTVLVTILQIRFSKGTGDLRVSAAKYRLGTIYLLGCCVVYSLAAHLDFWITLAVLSIGMVVHTIGELYTAAGSWSIGFDLAKEEQMGQYQGVYALGWGLGGTVGPIVIVSLIVGFGIYGWWVIGAGFLLAGLAMNFLVNRHPVLNLDKSTSA